MKRTLLPSLFFVVFALVACGKDTAKEVDNANNDQVRLTQIDAALREEKVYVLLPGVSEMNIRKHKDDAQSLARLDALLTEYVSRAGNVLSVAQNPDVNYNADILLWMPRKIQQAQTMLKQVRRERKELASI